MLSNVGGDERKPNAPARRMSESRRSSVADVHTMISVFGNAARNARTDSKAHDGFSVTIKIRSGRNSRKRRTEGSIAERGKLLLSTTTAPSPRDSTWERRPAFNWASGV